MGLDVSHDCWHGAYSSFHGWRSAICLAAGYGNYMTSVIAGIIDKKDPIAKLLYHSDCEGTISWKDCSKIANRLEEIYPLLKDKFDKQYTLNWIKGLKEAAKKKEDVEFH